MTFQNVTPSTRTSTADTVPVTYYLAAPTYQVPTSTYAGISQQYPVPRTIYNEIYGAQVPSYHQHAHTQHPHRPTPTYPIAHSGNAPLCPSTTSYQMMLQGSDRHHSLRAGFRGTSDQTDALDLSSRFSGASQGTSGIPYPNLSATHGNRSSVLEQQQLLRTLITGIRHVSELANLLAKINETFEGVYTPPPNPTSASFSYPTSQRAAGMGFPLTANPASNIDLATLMSRLDETNRAAPPPPLPYATSYGNLDFRDSPYFRSIYEYYLRQNLPGYLQSLANSTPLQPTNRTTTTVTNATAPNSAETRRTRPTLPSEYRSAPVPHTPRTAPIAGGPIRGHEHQEHKSTPLTRPRPQPYRIEELKKMYDQTRPAQKVQDPRKRNRGRPSHGRPHEAQPQNDHDA
ncbi:hypothetical protein HF086_008656 [Spodoptera exigua]|uniref:Uncharacterized protein n=1 Tax=Spodoptera exigua TaxID=7107 RepID=A0A922MX85_SPOEX|nr:hypothetical protein HF086_008656 [Spodoptera exigua]